MKSEFLKKLNRIENIKFILHRRLGRGFVKTLLYRSNYLYISISIYLPREERIFFCIYKLYIFQM